MGLRRRGNIGCGQDGDYIADMAGDYIELGRRFRRANEKDERPFVGLFDRSFRGESRAGRRRRPNEPA
ncbi:hypothetical protein SKA58_11348 [Sphingomonas sp. SKA58]|nr:hypothetical protein SKA58_11348 [Sphingomonas sp. SKA58]